ncbi:MAG: hypothetical protein WCJ93_00870 [Methanomicrobiales archaeon]
MAEKSRKCYGLDLIVARLPEEGLKYFLPGTTPNSSPNMECTQLPAISGRKPPVPRVIREVNRGGT